MCDMSSRLYWTNNLTCPSSLIVGYKQEVCVILIMSHGDQFTSCLVHELATSYK